MKQSLVELKNLYACCHFLILLICPDINECEDPSLSGHCEYGCLNNYGHFSCVDPPTTEYITTTTERQTTSSTTEPIKEESQEEEDYNEEYDDEIAKEKSNEVTQSSTSHTESTTENYSSSTHPTHIETETDSEEIDNEIDEENGHTETDDEKIETTISVHSTTTSEPLEHTQVHHDPDQESDNDGGEKIEEADQSSFETPEVTRKCDDGLRLDDDGNCIGK